jgi:hypothetical protein
MSKEELPALKQLARNLWIHLILAATVPMLSVMILVLSVRELDGRFALLALAAGGTIGFATAVSVFRLVQQDLQVLIRFIERSSR